MRSREIGPDAATVPALPERTEAGRAGPLPALSAPLTPGNVLALQRAVGNAAVGRALRQRDGLISTSRLAANLQQAHAARALSPEAPGVQFRLPSAAAIQAIVASGDVPEATVKDAVTTALTRMRKEGLLKSKAKMTDIVAKLFPAAGTFDEKEFAKVINVKNRSRIYEKAADSRAKVSAADKPKLISAMDKADKLIDECIADAAGLKKVFGSKDAKAKAIYTKAKSALATLKLNIDTRVNTDYNRDDRQIGLGGFASFSDQKVHLMPDVAAATDPKEAAITIIHECAHLADASVRDKGYYGTAKFEALSEDVKITNAAHFEELPRRKLKIGKFGKKTFTPGVAASGGAVTFRSEVMQTAGQYLQQAWDAAVDTHMGIREIKIDIDNGSNASFVANKALLVEISKLEKLTIHKQTPAPKTVNLLDVVLAEGVARATVIIQQLAEKQTVPATPAVGKTKQDYADEVVAAATKAYNGLTGNPADDKKLLDWMVAHFHAVGLPLP
jgi:hypothetical protein